MSPLEQLQAKIEQGDLHSARQLALRLIGRGTRLPEPWEQLAWIDYRLGDVRSSLASLEEATLLGPLSERSRILIAYAHAHAGRNELAIDLLDLAIGPFDEDETRTLQPQDRLLAATTYALVGRYDLALRSCRQVAEADPNNGEAYHLASRFGAACGLPQRTVESLARRAVSLEPTVATYRLGLAELLYDAERIDEAADLVADFTPEEIRAVGSVEGVEFLAEIYESRRDWRRVVVCREQLLQLEVSQSTADER